MRFELTVALKYLLPRWRQLSVSIISLISVLVISLVVWLVVLFLSVTDGIEKKWVEQLVALNAPVRMAPTEAYYNSYYYQVDNLSLESNYTPKTIGEKLTAFRSDPYDANMDVELPYDFPHPDRRDNHELKDPVKEGWEAITSLKEKGIRPQEYEVSYGNLHLTLSGGENNQQTAINQITYIASHDSDNTRLAQMLLPIENDDYNNLLATVSQEDGSHLKSFFDHVEISQLQTTDEGFLLTSPFFPESGNLEGIGIVKRDEIRRVVIPQSTQELSALQDKLEAFGFDTTPVTVIFDQEQMHLVSEKNAAPGVQLVLSEKIPFHAKLIEETLAQATALSSVQFHLEGSVQNIPLSGTTYFDQLEIAQAQARQNENAPSPPPWIHSDEKGCSTIPCDQSHGDGILVAKHFKNNGVRLGDRGYLAYYTPTASSTQEQRLPIYVAGFYDPGMMPVGNKLIFTDPQVVSVLRGNLTVSDSMLGNGINIWLNDIAQAESVKKALVHSLESRGIDKYWTVQSYQDYDFARPILQQLQSDKHLFTLIALIILIVACSNIISMLILLVNDKKREIGILQAMGASPRRIATIFGLCGFVMGIASCIIGTLAAIFTLSHLQSLVNFLSFMQGHEAFQTAFYGSSLPNELSFTSLLFVIVATMVISLLAGIVPAIKAARVRPTEILRAE
ncbi:MAG: hypothetical protein S4CHLAM2_00390 [Chlamydiales bacterium]|nr:hypothetical protein [Chlamydiales bacterium]